jgi:non-specific protein-tyrosine kinase
LELKRYLVLFRRWWWLVISLTLLGGVSAFIAATAQPSVYQATTRILINQAPGALPDATAVLTGQHVSSTYAQLLQKRPVLEAVSANLALDMDPGTLKSRITVRPLAGTNLLEVTVQDGDAQRAADIANEVVRVFIAQNVDFQSSRYAASIANLQTELEQIQADIERTEANLEAYDDEEMDLTPEQIIERNRQEALLSEYRGNHATLLESYEQIRLTQAQSSDRVTVVEEALSGTPVGSASRTRAIQGALVGIALAVGGVLLIEYLDDTVRSVEEVANITGVPLLGMIGDIRSVEKRLNHVLVTVEKPRSTISESYRILRTSLESTSPESPPRTILITSSGPGEGKTTTSANLAVALAQAGNRVILVDADMRRASLHKLFGQDNNRGISTALMETGGHLMSAHWKNTAIDNLYLMPSGPLPPNPADILQSHRTAELVAGLREQFDTVILDSPPVLAVADPTLLARICDATLLVVLANTTRAGALQRAKEQLLQSGASLRGVALNRVTVLDDSYYYYHYYNYYGSDKG